MKQVLIVDDSQPIRQRIAALLEESSQIRIIGQAGTRREGWQTLQHLHPDTVILDIQLPDESGIELLKQIKANFPEIKVIMLTNYDFQQYRQQCRQLGADHFLSKTLEFDKVIDAVLDQ